MKTLFFNCTTLCMDEQGTILPNAFVVVEHGNIASVGTQRPKGSFDREIDGLGNILMPGLVNAHTHVPMTLLRGYGGGTDLQTWLHEYIFPAEAKMDARCIRAGTKLALAELIANGVTTIADMYDFCEVICEEVVGAGISANIARGTTLFQPEFDAKTYPPILEARQLAKNWHGYGEGQILVDVSIHGEYTSRAELWRALADLAQEENLGMHVHVSETRAEQEACIGRSGKTPLQTLDDYGVWNTRAIAAHCVYTTPEDWALMKERGVTCVHNPVSNLKLGSGIAPIPAMKQAGVALALGTDGVSSNNSHDMFGEMKMAAVLHNGANCDPLALRPMDVLHMATSQGARALGRKTGQIQAGYVADIILVNSHVPHMTPCHNVADNLVYSARGSDVVLTMARGKVLYEKGVYTTLDVEETYREVQQYALPLLFPRA